jgi:preprotein translocase subunit YajC
MVLNLALLTASPVSGLIGMLPTLALFGVLLYFMIYRPQKKRQQNAQNLLSSLQVGDKIQTIGGFTGEIVKMEDDEFIIVSEESKMRIKKNAVAIRVDATVEIEESVEVDTPVVDDEDDDFKIEDFEI